jgi:hypothetical protein
MWGEGQSCQALPKKLMETLKIVGGLPLMPVPVQRALANNMVLHLERGVITWAVYLAWDAEALVILPQGSMASDTSASPGN